ncbi:MAG: glycosyltransferase family 9 protein [Woeseia sp.]|nr:glycosyltransferase family 9 protein [Woeseia sp.]
MFKQSPPDRICMVRLSAIGDTCQALAVARAIQDTWPETRITWILGKTEASLLADIPDIEFIIFDKAKGIAAYQQVRRKLAGKSFDAALCMHASLRANFLYPLIRTAHRIGYDPERARDYQRLFTNQCIPATKGLHVQDAMMSFARFIGVPEQVLRWDIPLSTEHREFAAQYRRNGQPLLLLSPCSSQRARNFRNWSAENYAAAALNAVQKFGCHVVLTGGQSAVEQHYAQSILAKLGGDASNLMGRTSLKQLLALIDEANCLLCPDSGPAHMATTVGTPVIGLYATSNPDRTGPYLSRHLTVNAYPHAVQKYLGKGVGEVRWGQRVRDAGAMELIPLVDVNERIAAVFGS